MKETLYTKTLYKAIRKLNLDQEELKDMLLCLYVTGCPSKDCAKLFGADEERIIKFLESEELYGYKSCNKCGKLRDRETEFHQYKTRKIGVCKICNKEYHKHKNKEYNEKNKEYRQKQYKKYDENNKEKRKEYQKNNKDKIRGYYENNKEKIKEDRKKYYEDNKDEILKYSKVYNQQEAPIHLVQQLAGVEDVTDNQIKCKYCGRWMTPTNLQVHNRLRGMNKVGDGSYIYCSEECKEECPTYGRLKYPKGFKVASSREVDPALRQMVLARDDYTCQKCGEYENVRLHCHHTIPAVNSPMEANDMDNCITLCKECHHKVHKIPGCGYGELRCEKVDE